MIIKQSISKILIYSLIASLCFSVDSMAANKNFSGKFEVELFDSYNYESDDKSNEFNENYFRAKLDLKNKITKKIYLKSQFRFKDVNPDSEKQQRRASENPGDRSFEDEGLYVKQLNLNYKYNNNLFSLGKITTKFSKAASRKDNIWLFNEARSNYRQDEKIGIANYFSAGDVKKSGLYNLGISGFTNDNKYLNSSTVTKRDTDGSGANPGDSRGLKSYVASMDINYDFGGNEELSYHFSYLKLDVNRKKSNLQQDKISDIKGYTLNMNYKYPVLSNSLAEGFVEYVKLDNDDGDKDKDSYFLTTSLSFYFLENYGVTLGRYQENKKQQNVQNKETDIKEFNLSYNFAQESIFDGLRVITGFKREKESYNSYKNIDNIFGVRLRYVKSF